MNRAVAESGFLRRHQLRLRRLPLYVFERTEVANGRVGRPLQGNALVCRQIDNSTIGFFITPQAHRDCRNPFPLHRHVKQMGWHCQFAVDGRLSSSSATFGSDNAYGGILSSRFAHLLDYASAV
jgi:hypothetical protein